MINLIFIVSCFIYCIYAEDVTGANKKSSRDLELLVKDSYIASFSFNFDDTPVIGGNDVAFAHSEIL